jgi:4-amino-4-deoxy-L-arabinose transferase-like glycosyltransferase
LLIALTWIAIALIINPFQNTPLIDDWVYAWPVEELFRHQTLKIIDYSSTLNIVQALWGGIFCLPTGFSFAALRLSTWVAALFCLIILYLLLRESGVERRDARLGVATLGVNPMFVILANSFMTDVPFLACVSASLLAFVRAISMQRDEWLFLAVFFAALAMGIRITGVVLPIAMSLVLLMRAGPWGRRQLRFLVPSTAMLLLAGMVLWRIGHTEHIADLSNISNSPQNRTQAALLYGAVILPQMLVVNMTFVAGVIGVAMLPLSLACVNRRSGIAIMGTMLTVWACVALTWLMGEHYYQPLSQGETWALDPLAVAEGLVPNRIGYTQPAWLTWSITIIALSSGAVVLQALIRHPTTSRLAFLKWVIMLDFLLLAFLWLFYDRYGLSFLLVAIILLLAHEPVRHPRTAIVILTLFGVYSLVSLTDHLRYNAATWQAVDELRRRRVPVSQIDGGYVVNGWLQYAHPELAARDASGQVSVPWVNSNGTLRYQISNSIIPGRKVIDVIPYVRWLWLGRSGAIYILEDERKSRDEATRS